MITPENQFRTRAALFALIVLLTGCSGIPEYTFNAQNTAIQTVAVAPTQHDEELLLRFRQDQLESVDIVTPIPVAKLFTFVAEENREAKFAKQVGENSGTYARMLQLELASVMEAAGYQTIDMSEQANDERSRDRHGLLKTLPQSVFDNADALLESSSAIGFTAAGRGKPFKPTLWFTTRLTDRRGNVLLFDQIQLNPEDGREQGLIVYPTDAFVFENQEALTDDKRRAEALEYAIRRITHEFAYLVRGPALEPGSDSPDGAKLRKVTVSVPAEHHENTMSVVCAEALTDDIAQPIPDDKTTRTEIVHDLQCRWGSSDTASTGSLLFRIPASDQPLEVEVAARLDAKGTVAAHVAELDASFDPVKFAPFANFKERKGYLVARFFLESANQPRYVLVGGAANAVSDTLARTYAPVTTSLLNFAGLVTARELQGDFSFITEGDIRMRIRKPQKTQVKITE